MSVLIKGMKMPKSCIGCLFSSIESCDETEPPKIRCTIHGDFAHEVDWHEVCPLVEVPTPHGRLIDSDAILGKINAIISAHPDEADLYEQDAVIVKDWLRSEPTVIEREEV